MQAYGEPVARNLRALKGPLRPPRLANAGRRLTAETRRRRYTPCALTRTRTRTQTARRRSTV